jgi:hypothetical protein
MMGDGPTVEQRDERTIIRIPMEFKRRGGRREIIVPEGLPVSTSSKASEPVPLVVAVARARRWLRLLEGGRYADIADLARDLGVDRSYVSRLLRLALLAPDIVKAIVDGAEPSGLSFRTLVYNVPRGWDEQRKRFGFPVR